MILFIMNRVDRENLKMILATRWSLLNNYTVNYNKQNFIQVGLGMTDMQMHSGDTEHAFVCRHVW